MNNKLDTLTHLTVFGTKTDLCPKYSQNWSAAARILEKLFEHEEISHLEIFWEDSEEKWAAVVLQETPEVTITFKKYGPSPLKALALVAIEYFKGVNYLNQ